MKHKTRLESNPTKHRTHGRLVVLCLMVTALVLMFSSSVSADDAFIMNESQYVILDYPNGHVPYQYKKIFFQENLIFLELI